MLTLALNLITLLGYKFAVPKYYVNTIFVALKSVQQEYKFCELFPEFLVYVIYFTELQTSKHSWKAISDRKFSLSFHQKIHQRSLMHIFIWMEYTTALCANF